MDGKAVGGIGARPGAIGGDAARKLHREQDPDEWGAPRIKGFPVGDVYTRRAMDTHEDLRACLLPDSLRVVYVEHWRARISPSRMHATFKAISEMAAARASTDR